MEGYLGETVVDIKDTPFKSYTSADWALYFIGRYGGIDGEEHKDWTMDQAARVLHGAEITIKLSRWDNGMEEYRVSIGEPTPQYHAWVFKVITGEDGTENNEYSVGRAP